MKTKISKSLNIMIRLIIVLLTLLFIYDQVFHRRNFQSVLDFLSELSKQKNFYFLTSLVILLMPVNLIIESWKWKFLIGKIEKITLENAFKAILTGISVSMFMPNRVGEYFGRIYVLKTGGRIQSILITFVGSMAQLLTTLVTGFIASVFFLSFFLDFSDSLDLWLFIGFIILIIFIVFFLILGYLNFSFLSEIIKKISGRIFTKIEKYTNVFSWYSTQNLLTVFVASVLRFFVFSLQFYILLKIFYVPVNYPAGIMLISIVYFLMTIIPTIALTELGIRGSVSIYVFGLFLVPSALWTDQVSLGVFSASSFLWLLNIGFPALTGTLFVYNLRFFRNTSSNVN